MVLVPLLLHSFVAGPMPLSAFTRFRQYDFPANVIFGYYYFVVVIPFNTIRRLFRIAKFKDNEINILVGLILCIGAISACIYLLVLLLNQIKKTKWRGVILIFHGYSLPGLIMWYGAFRKWDYNPDEGRGLVTTLFFHALFLNIVFWSSKFVYYLTMQNYKSEVGFNILPEWDRLSLKNKLKSLGQILIGLR
jgi:hypothetical protein